MNRRQFTILAGASALVPVWAQAKTTNYSPGLVDQELAAGKTVFLDFRADWCSTCASQERTIEKLMSENPDYAANVSFINVDWDQFRSAELTKRLKIPRRSTLVVLKGDKELGRIVAGVSKKDIKALMDTALAAAQSA
ncbi:MAG: thioredoxin family protein [Pseudoruegeria sp.]